MARLKKLDVGRLSVLLILVVGTIALLTKDQWDWFFSSDEAQTQGVSAETIDDLDAAERLYRVSPNNGSSASYTVEETLAGREGLVTGTTQVMAGDIAINTEDPAASRVGEIVVNVEMFKSDSNLRDKRLRHDFLSSTHFPFATFVTTSVDGLDGVVFVEGETYDISLTGDLTVKETTQQETFTGTVTVGPEQLRADVSTQILSSHYDVGPIHAARLAHTKDEVELSFAMVADRVALDSTGEADLATEIDNPDIAGGTFAATVQPILEENCVSCHAEGGPGFSTLEFNTAADAASIADDIALVTDIGFMPPWLPSEDGLEYHNEWRLTDDELATIAEWAADGGGLDVPPDTELVARSRAIEPIREDLVLPPREPYAGDPDVADDYRCQIHELPDPEGDGTWVTGFEFRPDQTEVVHHSIVYRVPAAGREEVEAKDGADGKPGWTCYGLSGLQTDGVGQIQGWAPGQQPTIYPEGTGLYLQPGDIIVNQTHFHYDHEAPADASEVIFQVATDDEAEGLRSIQGSTYLTPAEIPCTPEEEGPLCDRDAAIAEIGEKYDTFATFIPDAMVRACGGDINDFNQLDGTRNTSSCDLLARNSGTIYSVLGHMHEFGASYKMILHPDTPDEIVLLDIPVWDFEWQLNYSPVEDIRIERGDVVRFECSWDRSLQFMPEPRYIVWNEGTIDEMCFSNITVIPDPPVGEEVAAPAEDNTIEGQFEE